MNWSDIGKIVATTMLSLGGAGVIIAVVIKISVEKIAERLFAKYELKLNKELETYKSALEKKNYISKARFDLEINICGKISEALSVVVDDCIGIYIPIQTEDRVNEMDKHCEQTRVSIKKLYNILVNNAPFISETLYNNFYDFYKELWNYLNIYYCINVSEARHNLISKREEIITKHKEITNKMRTYFRTLEIND